MMEDVYTSSYYCRVKDEYTTNPYRLMDISATSPSRMEDDYTTSYYCRLKVESTTNYYRLLDIPATNSSKMLLLNKEIDVPKELPLSIEMEVAINSSQYCQSVLPNTFSTFQYCQLVLIKTSTPPAPRASYQTLGTQAGRTPACTAELLNVS